MTDIIKDNNGTSFRIPTNIYDEKGSVAAVIGFYSRRPAFTRYTSFAANGLWLAYDVIVGNITATVSCAILLLSALVGTLRALWQQKTEKQ
jgi:hypothetical protein